MPSTSKVRQIILVAFSDLRYPDWNPRDSFDEDEMQSLMDYISAGGEIPPIIIWTPSAENAGTESPDPPRAVISGKRRCEAYRRMGLTHIEAIPMDITLEEAMFMALAANRDSKPFWLNEFIAVERLMKRNDKLKQVEIIAKTGWTKKRISKAVNLIRLLNQASRELIFQSNRQKVTSGNFLGDETQDNTTQKADWRFTEGVAIRLIPLLDENALKVSQDRAEVVVRTIIDQQLTGPQTDGLVAHTLTGNNPAQFKPAAKVRKPRTVSHSKLQAIKTDNPSESPIGDKPTQAKPDHSANTHIPTMATPATPTPNNLMSEGETMLWDAVAGISVISQIKTKIKKGERPSLWEAFLLAGHYISRGLGWLSKHGFKFMWRVLKFFGKLLKTAAKDAAKLLGKKISGFIQLVATIAFIVIIVWLCWGIYRRGIFYPIRVIESKFRSPAKTQQPNPVVRLEASQSVTTANADENASNPATVASAMALPITPTVQRTPNDVIGSVAKQVGPDLAGTVAKKLFGL